MVERKSRAIFSVPPAWMRTSLDMRRDDQKGTRQPIKRTFICSRSELVKEKKDGDKKEKVFFARVWEPAEVPFLEAVWFIEHWLEIDWRPD